MDQVLSNPRAHAGHIEKHTVNRIDPEWQKPYADAECAAPTYDPLLRKAAALFFQGAS
jgi:hypothetical protein